MLTLGILNSVFYSTHADELWREGASGPARMAHSQPRRAGKRRAVTEAATKASERGQGPGVPAGPSEQSIAEAVRTEPPRRARGDGGSPEPAETRFSQYDYGSTDPAGDGTPAEDANRAEPLRSAR